MDEPLFPAEKMLGPAIVPALVAPHGLEQILATFGDIHSYIRPGGSLDPRWQADYMANVELPISLPLSWNHSQSVSRMTCHKRMVDIFAPRYLAWCRHAACSRRFAVSAGVLPFASKGLEQSCQPTVGA